MFRSWTARLCAAATCLVLSACGGGGGGGDGGASFEADKSAVSVVGINGSTVATDTIRFTMDGGSGDYYATALSDSEAVEMSLYFGSDNSATVTVSMGSLATGRRASGVLTFLVCRDEACTKEVWRKTVNYTATMYALDTRALALTGHEGVLAPPVALDVVPPDTGGELVFDTASAGFLVADHSAPDKVLITASAVGLAAGNHAGSVTIGVRRGGQPMPTSMSIEASFTVGAGIVAPAVPALVLRSNSAAPSLSGQASVGFSGSQSAAWTAHSDSDWLVLDTAAGQGAGTIDFHVDTDRAAGLPNWRDHSAVVTLSAPGLTPVTFPVTLHKRLADVAMVTPSGILSGAASEVRVTGRGFAGLGAADFSVGGVAPSAAVVASDNVVTLSLPPLAAGARQVSVPSGLGGAGATAALGVRDAGTIGAASVPTTGGKRAAVFDASRQAIYATVHGGDTLVRIRLVDGAWQTSAVPVGQVGSLALSPDGSTVYVASGSRLLAIDAETLETRQRHDAPFRLDGGFTYGGPLPQTHDLRLWFGGNQWDGWVAFDRASGGFDPVAEATSTLMYSPQLFAPADGSALLLQASGISPAPPRVWYDAATANHRVLHDGPPDLSAQVRFNADGSLMLLDGQALYRTSDFSLLGHARPEGGLQPWETLLSPDGRRIYVAVALPGSTVIDHVEVFDATQSRAGTSDFARLGEIALPDKAVGCNVSSDSECDARGRWMLDPTGTVLFWIGDAKLVVVPVSPAMSGLAAGRANGDVRRLRAATAATSR